MSSVTEDQGSAQGGHWARKYPPLMFTGVAIVVALLLLPSALNLPQSNPTQTLEYAPVPPEEEETPPQQGNLAAVGLGESSTAEEDTSDDEDQVLPPLETPEGQGVNPDFRCVGNPPRQTEDPLAPPCVPFFDGDNFGATYQGVTGDEIRILFFLDGGINYSSGSDGGTDNVSPSGEYFDLFEAPDPDTHEHLVVRGLRSWQKYFNLRFQTYGRRVHFFVYFADCTSSECTPEDRRAAAADNFNVVKPFAVVSDATEGAENEYLIAMARKGVLNFGSFGLRPSRFFQTFPKLIWSYLPSIEQQSESYISYVCEKVVGHPVSMAGAEFNGQERRLGLIATEDANEEGLLIMADLVKQRVTECGGNIVAEARFPNCCLAQDNGEVPTYAQQQMAEFRQEGVTTILWAGGINGNYGKFANQNGYVPEWIVLGDGLLDANNPVRLSQNTAAFDDHAVVVTPQVLEPALEQQRCYQAFREVDPDTPRTDLGYVCEYYKNLFQLFVGIQVAGPRLGPTSVDKGFHAIPQKKSGDPQVPACFYLPGDYTCVKDAQVEYWDAGGRAPGDERPGCWRSIGDPAAGAPYGSRYLPGEWPAGNIDAQIDGGEPCNGYSASVRFNLA